MIVILGGTTEARKLGIKLRQKGIKAVISVVTEYGGGLAAEWNSRVEVGSKDTEGISKLLEETGAVFLVDATHPFAWKASINAMEAARKVGITYLRLERERESIPYDPLIRGIDRLEELPGIFSEVGKGAVIFSTLGSSNLKHLVKWTRDAGNRLIARVMPLSSVIESCEEIGMKSEDLLAYSSPGSRYFNRCLFFEWGVNMVLLKESGREGGQSEKIAAALDAGCEAVVWRRPQLEYPYSFSSVERTIAYLVEALKQ